MEEAMKKQILNVVVTLSIIVTLTVAGFAALRTRVEANVPFDFMVSGKTLPAGQYSIALTDKGDALMIRNGETKQGVIVMARNCEVAAAGKPQLIFNRYGNQYFLAKVLGQTSGNELLKSKAEREAARANRDHLAQQDAAPQIITVNAQIGQ
jgi:hypothetical protein